jgi:hypothetical protein
MVFIRRIPFSYDHSIVLKQEEEGGGGGGGGSFDGMVIRKGCSCLSLDEGGYIYTLHH